MIHLSVNVNKVATLRNSRGGNAPSVLKAVTTCAHAGVHGVTVHPRADQRHITPIDVRDIASLLRQLPTTVEYNMEGDPRADFLELVLEVKPDQCTLVPVVPGEITSRAGWASGPGADVLPSVIRSLKAQHVRVSLFVEPTEDGIRLASTVGADRVELYTEPFARAFEEGPERASEMFDRYVRAATLAHLLGLGVNAGHDLDLENLVMFRGLPYLTEVSIGHALISRAVFVGLDRVVREYLGVLS